MANTDLRITVEYDSYPDMSYFEQWNTPDKYYGGEPHNCTHPHSEYNDETCDGGMVYKEDHTWECEDCDHTVNWDGVQHEDGLRTDGGVMFKDGKPIPFDEYMQAHGNPDNYTSLEVVVEKSNTCGYCQHTEWEILDTLCGIDIYAYGSESWELGKFTVEQVNEMPDGHLKETIIGMLPATPVNEAA